MTKRRVCGRLEHLLNAFACQRRTLDVGVDVAQGRHPPTLFRRHRGLPGRRELLDHARVGPEVLLRADENQRNMGAEVGYFGQPLVDDVGQAVRTGNAEAE